MGEMVVTLGLDRAISRFLPIYHERRDFDNLFGTIILAVSSILSLGVALVLLVWAFQGSIVRDMVDDQQVVTLLLILVALSPIQALDGVVSAMFAIFVGPRSIFFRKHLLAPGMKLAVVVLLVLHGNGVSFLAGGYVAAAALGLVIYIAVLFRALMRQGLFRHFRLKTTTLPRREILLFTIPLLTSDLMHIFMNSMDAFFLKHFHSTVEVAAFRAVQPAARLNQLVLASSSLMFLPLASRLFALNDREGISKLYWQTTAWIAVVSFPLFVITFSFARPVTVLLYGKEYEESAAVLAMLSLGYYFNSALGLNGYTLTALGKMRFVVAANVVSMAVSLGMNLLLIPRYGAFGAAVGNCGAVVARNIIFQTGLRRSTEINLLEWRYLKIYLVIGLVALGLLVLQSSLSLRIHFSLALAALGTFVVFRLNRKALGVGKIFPELLRIPLARHLFRE
jgi:O-antigen/teichoic acid export membrane protein